MNSEYYKNYWKRNPEKYEEHKRKVREYKKTEKGKEVVIKAKLKFNENNPNFIKDYMADRRKKAKSEGICTKCFKVKVKEGSVACERCLKQSLECTKNWLKKKKEREFKE